MKCTHSYHVDIGLMFMPDQVIPLPIPVNGQGDVEIKDVCYACNNQETSNEYAP